MKSYTDIEQSKKLIESGIDKTTSDMHYEKDSLENYYSPIPLIGKYSEMHNQFPCWSLAALLGFIPNYKLSSEHNYHTCTAETSFGEETVGWFDSPVDACYEMILKLKKLLVMLRRK